MPTRYDPQQEAIDRQRKLAALLQQDSMTPDEGQMVSGHYVAPSWTQHAAKLAKALTGSTLQSRSDEQAKALEETRQKGAADWMSQMPTAQNVEQPMPEGQMGPGVIKSQAPDQGQMLAWALKGLQNPQTQDFAQSYATQIPQMEDRRIGRQETIEARREAQTAAEQAKLDAQARDNAARAERQLADIAAREEARRKDEELKRYLATLSNQNRPAPQAQIIQTDQGPMRLLPDGRAAPILGPEDKPIGAKSTSASTKEITAAKAKETEAKDVLNILSEAAPLIKDATGSGIGSLVDTGVGLFGRSTTGADAIASLRSLEGLLVSKMPKMSGPQSDKDVLLYKQMAGQIGDPSVPTSQKKKAMETIAKINSHYAGIPYKSPFEAENVAAGKIATPTPAVDPQIDALLSKYGKP